MRQLGTFVDACEKLRELGYTVEHSGLGVSTIIYRGWTSPGLSHEAVIYAARLAGNADGSPLSLEELAQMNPGAVASGPYRAGRPTYCGGCGETNPAKRCIGCLADFGPADEALE